jgi:hypothetical protein
VTTAEPAALETDADAVALAELAAELDDDAGVDDVLEESSSFEQAATPPTAIAAAPMATHNSYFTISPSPGDPRRTDLSSSMTG